MSSSPTTSIQSSPDLERKDLHTEMMQDEYRVMFEVEDKHWWYRGMRRNLFMLLQKHHNWQAIAEPCILDAGCGTGANLQQLLTGFGNKLSTRQALGFDLSAEALEFSFQRGLSGRIARASITQIPFASDSFDIALSFDVINNLPEDLPAFLEISRVLKRGGLFILNLPAYQFLYSEHDLAIRGQRRYNARLVAERMAQAGLRVERQTYLNTLLFPPAALVRLVKARRVAARPEQIQDSVSASEVHSDLTPPHPIINRTLEQIMALEARLLGKTNLNLPFGLSIMTLARKM
ncbi:MAG TPA: class I SAM-dependent methyltransferase [Chloroflexia bacterium]|nr:class I SAM-dependent methyltransferase [Chloroflexia bacterium]